MDFTEQFKKAVFSGIRKKEELEKAGKIYDRYCEHLLRSIEEIRFKYMKNEFTKVPRHITWTIEMNAMIELLCALIETDIGGKIFNKGHKIEESIIRRVTESITMSKAKGQ